MGELSRLHSCLRQVWSWLGHQHQKHLIKLVDPSGLLSQCLCYVFNCSWEDAKMTAIERQSGSDYLNSHRTLDGTSSKELDWLIDGRQQVRAFRVDHSQLVPRWVGKVQTLKFEIVASWEDSVKKMSLFAFVWLGRTQFSRENVPRISPKLHVARRQSCTYWQEHTGPSLPMALSEPMSQIDGPVHKLLLNVLEIRKPFCWRWSCFIKAHSTWATCNWRSETSKMPRCLARKYLTVSHISQRRSLSSKNDKLAGVDWSLQSLQSSMCA